MKDILAEELLVKVMKWSAAQIKQERPVLQALARYMYDEYQQFSPGMRFISSLALWLNQFAPADRQLAYTFMRNHLLFIGQSELKHLISTAFPDYVQPLLLEQAAQETKLPRWAVTRAMKSVQYKCLLRQSLFLGLSDGAHIDLFRRSNPLLSNEQIWSTYEVADTKRKDLVSNLIQGLTDITGTRPLNGNALFKSIFLLDDFSASGRSYFMEEAGEYKGKIPKVLSAVFDKAGNLHDAVDLSSCQIHVLLYVATEAAVSHIQIGINKWMGENQRSNICRVRVVQSIPANLSLTNHNDSELQAFLKQYFDPKIVTSRLLKKSHSDLNTWS